MVARKQAQRVSKARVAANGIKKSPGIRLRCPLVERCESCANRDFPNIRRVNEHIRRTHLNTDKPEIYSISESEYERIVQAMKKNHRKLPGEKLSYIRKALFPVETDVATRPSFKPTYDQLKAAAKAIGSYDRRDQLDDGASQLVTKISSLALSVAGPAPPASWFAASPEHQQWEHLRRACQLFPFIIDAMQFEGYNPPPPPPSSSSSPPPSSDTDQSSSAEPWPELISRFTNLTSHHAAAMPLPPPVTVSAIETSFDNVEPLSQAWPAMSLDSVATFLTGSTELGNLSFETDTDLPATWT